MACGGGGPRSTSLALLGAPQSPVPPMLEAEVGQVRVCPLCPQASTERSPFASIPE